MSRCPFDGPADMQPEPHEPCPVCGDLGTLPGDNQSAPPSRCVSTDVRLSVALAEAQADIERLTRERDHWQATHAAERLAALTAEARATVAEADVERLTRERDEAEIRAGEMRMCLSCGKVRHAGEPKDDLPECSDPATGLAACTWDATPQEAWEYWRAEAHKHRARATAAEAERDALREAGERLHAAIIAAHNQLTGAPRTTAVIRALAMIMEAHDQWRADLAKTEGGE